MLRAILEIESRFYAPEYLLCVPTVGQELDVVLGREMRPESLNRLGHFKVSRVKQNGNNGAVVYVFLLVRKEINFNQGGMAVLVREVKRSG